MNKATIFEDFIDEDGYVPHGEESSVEASSLTGVDLTGLKQTYNKLFNDGYRSSKVEAEEVQMQLGFDRGFQHGMETGRSLGAIYQVIRQCICEMSHNIINETQRQALMSKCDQAFAAQIPACLTKSGGVVDRSVMDILHVLLADLDTHSKSSTSSNNSNSSNTCDVSQTRAELSILVESLGVA